MPFAPKTTQTRLFSLVIVLAMLAQACSTGLLELTQNTAPLTTSLPQPIATEPPLEAMIHFRVEVPQDPAANQGVTLNILDEVTGLALNTTRYMMDTEDTTHFYIGVPFPIGSVIKYRYSRLGEIPWDEHTSDGRQVRYRIVYVDSPGVIEDSVARWTDSSYSGETGRIHGTVIDSASSLPAANVLVACGGFQTLSASDGSFVIEGLTPGIHNLVAYSLDGSYKPFQQGAQIAGQATTPAPIMMEKAELVNVKFTVSLPTDTPPAVPVRIAGNLFTLGNMFANLSGGLNTVAARMPVMSVLPDGRYTLTLAVPAGTDLRYKYTLGDGFWNAEHDLTGKFVTRQLLVPDHGVEITDTVATWSDSKLPMLVFDVDAPANTPAGETVSIQFNPYGWTEPIPMWHLGGQRYAYYLFSPLASIKSLGYRYCRSDQCGSADDSQTIGRASSGRQIDMENRPEIFRERINAWHWLSEELPPVSLESIPLQSRPATFMRGIELQNGYHPSYLPKFSSTAAIVTQAAANTLVFSPTWSFTRINPPVFEAIAGQDALFPDLIPAVNQAHAAGLQAAIFPTPRFGYLAAEWWSSAQRDYAWWVVWFERYRAFILNYANLAQRTNAEALILGGDWIAPALPGGKLIDGMPSNVPADADQRWRDLIAEVRAAYEGKLLWAFPFASGNTNLPSFVDEFDQLYVLWSAALAEESGANLSAVAQRAGELLDQELKPLVDRTAKPVILAVSYPSAAGGLTGCLLDPNGDCLDPALLFQPADDYPAIRLDFQEQINAYYGMIQAVNQRPWVEGMVSRGYYPAVTLRDKSASLRGKPAEQALQQAYSVWGSLTP